MPDLPTIAERLPGYETYTWNAFSRPAGTPQAVIDRLNAAALAARRRPGGRSQAQSSSATVVGSTPEELATHVQAELAKWAPVVKASGAQLD